MHIFEWFPLMRKRAGSIRNSESITFADVFRSGGPTIPHPHMPSSARQAVIFYLSPNHKRDRYKNVSP
jgi:hypothetical protein